MTSISSIRAREIIDSRARPTVEVDVNLSDGARGRAAVPSGASTGATEALELRDGDAGRYGGAGVLSAVSNVTERVAPELVGREGLDQESLDRLLIDLDGTPNKSVLGANATLGVSLAFAHASAMSAGMPLYRHLHADLQMILPVPMFNIINGGRHAENSTDFQEFMVVPVGFKSFRRALQAGTEVYHALRGLLAARKLQTAVGDEGGFAPTLPGNREAVELVVEAIEVAGYAPGRDCFIALDVAASELTSDRQPGYELRIENAVLTSEQLVNRYEQWVQEYPIVSIEDGMAEDDWDGWRDMTRRIGARTQLVGDDLYTTSVDAIRKGIDTKASNAVLIKPNQVGTLTETLDAIGLAQSAGWGTVMSHRSGETEDTTIADLAVATSTGQIKSGAPARGERTAKYNRLLRIEEELGKETVFAGLASYDYLADR
jgi:enolase